MKKPFVVGSIAMLCACAAENEASTTTLTSAELRPTHVVPTEPAIERITHAQCARAQACGAVEQRGIYRSADYCESDVSRATRDDMYGSDCVYVDAARLDACIEAIRTEPCSRMNESERSPGACRRSWLCR